MQFNQRLFGRMHLPKVVIFERFQLVNVFTPSTVHSPFHRTPFQIKNSADIFLVLYLHGVSHQHNIHGLHPLNLYLVDAVYAR